MRELTQSEWHRIAAADNVLEQEGHIVGIIEDGETVMFDR